MISDGVRFSINFLPFSFIQISTLIWNAKIVFLSRLSRVCSLEAFLICWTENWTWGVRIHLDKRAWEASFSQLASLYHSVSNSQYTFHTLWNPSHYTISRNRKISKNHKNTILGKNFLLEKCLLAFWHNWLMFEFSLFEQIQTGASFAGISTAIFLRNWLIKG